MSRFSAPLEIGRGYDRKVLALLWGLAGFQAIGRGVFTPKGVGQIFLFVTRERLGWMTPYQNFLDDDLLFWDGEKGHGSDDRIASASRNGEEIHLFYRDHRLTPFTYYGKVVMVRCSRFTDRPSEFVFNVVSIAATFISPESIQVAEEPADYAIISEAGMNSIDRAVTTKSRGIAQRVFRGNLLRLWQGSCAVTSVQETRVLRSSHIKPWTISNVQEKVDHYNGLLLIPNLDALFNEGLISFRDDGRMLVSDDWRANDQLRMHITPDLHLRTIHPESCRYLEFHRDVVFERERTTDSG
ncbi:MAG: HNH endonuclease [Opitutaceae bacterium]|nr:HNH endonuclease [Opitutaceae bacterium]